MKKNTDHHSLYGRWCKKMLRIVRLTFVMIFCLVLAAKGSVFSQNTKLSLNAKDVTLLKLFQEIESQSRFVFLYRADDLDLNRKMNRDFKEASIEEILSEALKGERVTYEIFDRQILISKIGVTSAGNDIEQKLKVAGVVTDGKGDPLPGVSVVIEGTTKGAITDMNGNYTLVDIGTNATLVFSFVGMQTQKIAVTGRTLINVVMLEDAIGIEEVVAIGYGVQKKVNLTGAVGSVKVDEQLASRSLGNVSVALAGLVPGLAVNQNTGMAGRNAATLMIRGLGTVNSATPLIVVDGMPDVDINRISPGDIESISVLKDASSSAVYGSRGANGVVLVKTKSGSRVAGQTKIKFTGTYAFEDPIKMIDLMPDYPRVVSAMLQAAEAGGNTSRYRWGAIEEWAAKSYLDPLRYPNTDWIDLTTRTGKLRNYNLSATGGNDKTTFYISGSIMDEEGMQFTNDFIRYGTRFNYTYKIRENIQVGAQFAGNWSKWNYALEDGWFDNSASGGLISAIAGVTPYDPNTNKYGGSMMYGEDATIFNPYRQYKTSFNKQDRQDMFAGANIEWEPLKGLKASVDYTLTYNNQLMKVYSMPHSEWNFQTGNEIRVLVGSNAGVTDTNGTSWRTLLNGRLNFERSFGKHDLGALIVYSEEYAFSRSLRGSRQTRIHPDLTEIDAALTEVQGAGGNSSSWGLRSYIGRLNYAFQDKYLLEMNFRYDGSSKFYSGRQYGFFPSMSVGWRFTEEKFLSSLNSFLSQGKFRFSYGGLGNNSGVGNFEQKETLATSNYTANGNVAMGLVNRKMINRNLSWEVTKVLNLGLDLGFLKSRLTAEIDYYNRCTTGMLRPDALSSMLSGAYDAPRKNIGTMRNQGIELNLTWQDRIEDFKYSVNLNGSYNTNKLKRWNSYLSRGNVFIDMPYQFVYTQVNRGGIIQNWQQIYDAPWQSAGSAPGDMLLEDLNGDGVVNGDDRKALPDVQQIRPTANFGMNMSASWKGFDLALYWSASAGRKDYWANHFNNVTLLAATQSLTYTQYYDSWTYDNRDAMLPRLVYGSRGTNKASSTYWLDDMSFIRLKNLQLGYSLPKRVTDRLKISDLRIYLTGENLWTITKYRGIDPEKALTGTGDENDIYPIPRTIGFGFNLGI
jgi:TonB-linked SusC/RagA family outer membrane protein